MRPFQPLLAVLIVLASAEGLWGQHATIEEADQVFKVYPFGGADPAPIMARSSIWGSGPRLYPYFSFDEYSTRGTEQTRRVVRMENPFIKVLILPAEGGKLLAAIEKSTGNGFVYENRVRKFRNVALRGPWTSGGVELNFGIVGHAPTTATPVDYRLVKKPNGDVACVVGALDLPSRTYWRVTYVLHPDKAYVETNTLYYNPQPLDQSYYVWMNGANKLTKDVEFIYPGTAVIGHNYAAPERPWPMTDDGRNLAIFREHRYGDPESFFIHGVMADHAGGYWHKSHFGFGHWALYEDMPGQKFFRWQLSRAGQIWEHLLTDQDGPYFEPQFGRLLDQNDHALFAPYSEDHWREIWFPYKKIGPMVKATPYGVLSVQTDAASSIIRIGFCALQAIDDDLVVRAGERELVRTRLVLKPMEVYRREVQWPEAARKDTPIRVNVGDKLAYDADPQAGVLSRPLNFRNYDETDLEGLYQQAQRDEASRKYDAALAKYLAVLKRSPREMRALTRVAGLYCRRAEYSTALDYARTALDYVMYDPDANYIYGVISRCMGNQLDAKETLGWAARSMKYRAAAYCQLGEIYLVEQNVARALHYLHRSLDYDTHGIKTLEVLATAYRAAHQRDKTRQTLRKLLQLDPLNHVAHFEEYLLDSEVEQRTQFTGWIRSEMPHETYIETASYYLHLGRTDEALQVLDAAPRQPTVRYWQAYLLRNTAPEKSRQLLAEAGELSTSLVFPHRQESIAVFKWAADAEPNDWKARYYLSLVYWGLRRRDEALALLVGCGDAPDSPNFYLVRAFLATAVNSSSNASAKTGQDHVAADFERAVQLGENAWHYWYYLATFYLKQGHDSQALTTARDASRRFPRQTAISVVLARSAFQNAQYQLCRKTLKDVVVLPAEGQRDVRDLLSRSDTCLALKAIRQGCWAEAVVSLEQAKEYPERLGTGKPHHPDFRIQDLLLALCYRELSQEDQAADAEQRVATYAPRAAAELRQFIQQWYREECSKQSPREAFDVLSKRIRRTE